MTTESEIAKAFLKGAALISDQARVGELKAAIARKDYSAVMEAVDITESAWDDFRVKLTQAYAEGAISEIDGMPYAVRPRWNSATSEVERYSREVIGRHITLIADDARQAVRETVADGIAFGRSTDRIALDIVGRLGAGGRVGGVVGLNAQQAKWVANMRQWLIDDPARALQYSKRDRRFDALIRRAVDDGRKLTAAQVDAITRAYADRLLRVRGQTIARTERFAATNNGRQEAWRQAADKAGLPYGAISKTWVHSARKMEPRPFHIQAGNERLTVQGLDTRFDIGGFSCLHPHDVALPAGEVINCSCTVKYSFNRNLRNG